MHSLPSALSSFALALALTLVAGVSSAQSDADRATARALAEQAQDALDAKQFTRAQELFDRAAALVRAPTLELGRARALVGMGRLVSAHETYQRIVREGAPADASPAFVKAVEEARSELALLARRLPSVTLRIAGPAPSSAQVTVDGQPIAPPSLGAPRFVDPGRHVVEARASGFSPRETTFSVREGESAEVPLTLEAVAEGTVDEPRGASEASHPFRTLGFVVGGVGVAALGASAATGLLYLGKQADVDDHCDAGGRCDREGLDAAASGETLGIVNTITLFGGLAAVGGGVALVLFTEDDPGAEAGRVLRTRAWASPTSAGWTAEGSF